MGRDAGPSLLLLHILKLKQSMALGIVAFLKVKVWPYNSDHIKRPHVFKVKKKKDTITQDSMGLSNSWLEWFSRLLILRGHFAGLSRILSRALAVAYIEEYNKRKLLTYSLQVYYVTFE